MQPVSCTATSIHETFLINDASETTIIDFAFSVVSPHPRELGMEQEQLSNVLSQVADDRPMQNIT
jgi:hypothetical protein